MSGNTFKFMAAFGAVALVGMSANAAATYTTEDDGATLVVAVDSDGATMDASQVSAAITKIKKTGPGTLTAVPLSTYTGDFSIEEGVYSFDAVGDLGVTNDAGGAGVIDVKENAKILHTSTKAGTLSGKTINLYGGTGANMETSTTDYPTSMGKKIRIVLKADATIKQLKSGRPSYSGTVYLNGHTLTLDGTGQFLLTGVVSNDSAEGGKIVCKIPLMTDYGLEFDAEHPGVVELPSGKSLYLNTVTANGWKIQGEKGNVQANKEVADGYDGNSASWEGPIELTGSTSKLSSYDGYKRKTVLNLKGVLSGSGALRVGPGWLNLHNPDIAYSGTVSVIGTSNTITNYGGLGVFNGAPCFTNSPSITFSQGARFGFMDDVASNVPKLTFVGDSTQSIFGGTPTNRATIAGIVKSDEGVLEVDSPVHVTGTTKVNGGTLRIPYRSLNGVPGLYETRVTPKDYTAEADKHAIFTQGNAGTPSSYMMFEGWNDDYLSHVVLDEYGVCSVGPRRSCKGFVNTSTANWDDGWYSGKSNTRLGWWYHGYVWNHSKVPEIYTVWLGTQSGGSVWLGEDHSTQLFFKYGAAFTAHGKGVPDAMEMTLQPGATRVDIFVPSQGAALWSFSLPSNGERHGLVYAPTSTCTAAALNQAIVNYYDEKSTANTNAVRDILRQFSEFKDDSGYGLLFTANVYGENDADKITESQPVFDNLEFAYGTTLDLSDNTVFQVKDLTGSPTVVNAGEFKITNNWTICAADFPKADSTVRHPMTVDGKLVFAEDATFSIDDEGAIERSSGMVVATATGGVAGRPKQAPGMHKKWQLKVVAPEDGSGNPYEVRLCATFGFSVFVR